MHIEKTKNATRNIFFGVILKLYQILLPFIMRTAIIYLLGIEYSGLNSLFYSILQVLNLAELGIGSAMVFSMYRPIAEDDTVTICSLMRLYKIYYRVIGGIVLVTGLILSFFLPHLITGHIPEGINIYILYFLNLGATVLSYWLFSYKNSILYAYQRTDVNSKIALAGSTIQYILQFIALAVFHNYYYYLTCVLCITALSNIATALIVNKMYPQYHATGRLDKQSVKTINRRIADLFTAKLGTVIIGSADTLVISAFLGLATLAIYQNYYFIMNSVISIIAIFFSSIMAGVGNSIVVDPKEKVLADFKVFSYLMNWIICICCSCFACLYQPFIKLWVGEELMLDYSCVVLFIVYFYTLEVSMICATYKDAAGIWHQDRFRPLIGALVNLGLNIFLVQRIGLYGILLSTIISCVFVSLPWLISNLFQYLFHTSPWRYVQELLFYGALTLVSVVITYRISCLWNGSEVIGILYRLVVAVILPNIIFLLVNLKNTRQQKAIAIMKRIVRNQRKKVTATI